MKISEAKELMKGKLKPKPKNKEENKDMKENLIKSIERIEKEQNP